MLKWLLTTLVLFTISSAAQLSAQEPQIAYYTFNQTSGQTVPNLAQPGQGNNPAFLSAAPAWQASGGPANGALNEYIDVSGGLNGIDTGIALATNQDFTIEFWFRKNNATGLEVFVSNNSNFHIYMDVSGRIRWFIGPGETLNSQASGYDDGNWHHIACTYRKRGGGDRARMYIDSQPRVTNNNVSDPNWGSNTVQLLHYTGLYAFTGDFDEFRWWNDDLNQGTINNNDDVEQLPAQPFLYGPNLTNIPDTTTYNHVDIIDNTTRTLPFEFHNGDSAGDYTGVAVSILAQNNTTATISSPASATVTAGSFAAFDIDVAVTTVPYTIDLQIDYTHNAIPQTYIWTISGATKTPLPDWLYYRFNEGSGSDVTNDSGPSTSTFSSAPTWNTTDPAVGIAAVDSATGYLDTGFDPSPLNGNDFTAEWWMRTTSSAGAQGMFSAGNDIAFGLFNGNLTIRNQSSYWYVNQATTVNDGAWHHLAYVYTSATQNLAIHLDGNLIFKFAFPINFTGTNVSLWRNRNSTTQAFLGEMDELRLWDGAIIPPVIGGGIGGEIVPDIVMHRPFGTVLANGAIDNLTGVAVGSTSNLTYTIENAGDMNLDVASATVVAGTNCSVGAPSYSATIGQSAIDTFIINVTPTSSGMFTATLTVNSNDPDTPAYTIIISGNAAGAAVMAVSHGGLALANPDTLTLANGTVGQAENLAFDIINNGGSTLNLTGGAGLVAVSASSGVSISITQPNASILAGSSSAFNVNMTPTTSAWSFTLSISSDDASNPIWTINVSGLATGPRNIQMSRAGNVLLSQGFDSFANTNVGSTSVQTYLIENIGGFDLNVSSVTIQGSANISASINNISTPLNIAGGGSIAVDLSITPSATGYFTATLVVFSNDPDTWVYVINISDTAGPAILTPADIQASRGSLIPHNGSDSFAGASIGSPAVQTYSISNLGGLGLTVSSIAVSSSTNVTAAVSNITLPNTIAGSGNSTFDLTVIANAPGAFTVTLTINSNDSDTPAYVINISDSATGAPAIALDQGANLDLPDPAIINRSVGMVGSSESIPFNIRNTGNWTLNLTNSAGNPVALITTSGASIVINQPAATAIAAGSNETFSIDYIPTAITWSFQLRIDNNDPTNSQWFINVSGTALRVRNIQMQRGPVISHTGADTFAGTSTGSPTVQTYNINNIGDLDLTVSSVSTSSSANVTTAISNISLPSTVTGLTSNTFDLTVTPNTPGAFTVTLTVTSNDSDTPNYVINISDTSTGLPKIAIDQGATVLANPDTVSPTGTIVGIPSVLPFVIRNTGNWNLNLTSAPAYVAQTQSGVTVNVTQPASGLILAGNNEPFSVSFMPTSTVWNFTLTIASNDGTNNPWVINVSGTSTFPDLEIRQGSTDLSNGVVHIDNSQILGLAANLPFLLRNLGNEDTNLTGSPAVQLMASSNVSTMVNQPAGTVVSGTLPFSVDINPTAANWNFTLLVASDDPAEPTWTVIVQGTAGIRQLELSRTGAVLHNTSDTISGITAGVLTDLVYTITNTGTVAVNIPSTSVSNINLLNNSSINYIIQPLAVALAPAASVNFTVQMTANDTGSFDADMQLNGNTPTNNPYLWTIDGNASPGGVVSVRDGVTSLAGGVAYALPNLIVGAPATTINLDVFNAGSAWLRLDSPTPLTIISSSANLTAGIVTQPTTAPINKATSNGFALSLAATSAGAYTVTLELASDDPSSPFTIVLTGNVATGIIGSTPTSHNFGNVSINSSVNTVVTLDNLAGGSALTISSIILSGNPAFSITGQNPSEVIGTGAVSTSPITVTYNPTGTGAHSATLTVQSDSNGGMPHIYNIPLSGSGVAGVISSSPALYDFGQLNINNSDNTVVTISNTGSGPLTISSITLTGSAAFSISGANPSEVLAGNSSSTSPITVSFDPTVVGVKNATIVIESDSNGGAPDVYNIALTGEGAIPTINIPTPPSTFAAQGINTGVYTQVVAIQNTGNGPLTLNSITLTGSTEFTLQGVVPGVVPAGGSVNVTIAWTPTIADILQSGMLVIDSDSGSTGTPVITNLPFGATAIQSVLTAPASISWGPVAMIQSKQVNITVNNTGSGPLSISGAMLAGANVANFTWITNPAPTTIPSSGSATFTIEFAPSFVGSHVATLTLTNDELGNLAPQTTRVINLDADGAPPVAITNMISAPDSGGPSEISFDIVGFAGDSVSLAVTYSGGSNPGPATIHSASKCTIVGNTITGLTVGDTVTFLWDVYATEFHTTANDYQLVIDPFDITMGLPGATATTPLLNFDRDGGFAIHDLPSSTPKGKFGHILIHDPVANKLVVFGGKYFGARSDELWLYDIDHGNWNQVAKSGTWPSALQYAVGIYDSINHRLIVFSGSSNSGYRNETWALDLSNNTWTEIASSNKPLIRFGAVMAYDAPNGRAIMHGGSSSGIYLNDTWSLDLTNGLEAWTQLAPGGAVPSGRWGHAAALDTTTPRLTIYGGITAAGAVDEVHELDLATNTWSTPVVTGTAGPRYFMNAIYDPTQTCLLVSGGYLSAGFAKDAWVLDIASYTWSLVGSDPAGADGRTTSTGAHDPVTQQGYYFGGFANGTTLDEVTTVDMSGIPDFSSADIKDLDANGPEGRWGVVSEFDEINNRLIVFGGKGKNRYDGATWALDRSSSTGQWARIATTGTSPGLRVYAASAIDEVGNRMFVHGGGALGGILLDELWVLDLNTDTWTQLSSGPIGRYEHALAYDSLLNRLVMFGGLTPARLNDTWVYDIGTDTWAQLTPTGTLPPARAGTANMFDSINNRLVIAGGQSGIGYNNDVWQLDLTTGLEAWTDISAVSGSIIPGRSHMAYGEVGTDLWLQGGYNGSTNDEIWTLDTSVTPVTWAQQTIAGAKPLQRFVHSGATSNAGDFYVGFGYENAVALYDVWQIDTGALTARPVWVPNSPRSLATAQVAVDIVNNRLIAYGGLHEHNIDHGLYALDLTTPRAQWVGIDVTGTVPQPRRAASFVYDATGKRMIMYGGLFGELGTTKTDELWTLSLIPGSESWIQHTNPAIPGLRSHHIAFVDGSDRMWLIGGVDSGGNDTIDVHQLDLASMTWTTITPTGTAPAVRSFSAGIYDPVANRIVIYGGSSNGTNLSDTIMLDLSGGTPSWSTIPRVGTGPAYIYYHTAVYDPTAHRMVVFGGYYASSQNELHVLDLATDTWSQMIPPVAKPQERWAHGAGWDVVNNRMVITGGFVNAGITSTNNSGDGVQTWFWGD